MSTTASSPRAAARRGFTLIELLVVVTVILILASMILAIRPVNPEGLANGQRMLASMLRSARAQAMSNRAALPRPPGFTGNWAPAEFRYRVLIRSSPADPDRHLREMVIAIGTVGVGASPTTYTWFSPDPPVVLPPNIFLVPPSGSTLAGATPDVTLSTAAAVTGSTTARRSIFSALADNYGLVEGAYERASPGANQATMMRYRPVASPVTGVSSVVAYNDASVHGLDAGGSDWYYVELSADGASAHAARALLVLAEGLAGPGGGVIFQKPDAFAAVLLRRNGETALTVDSQDFEETELK